MMLVVYCECCRSVGETVGRVRKVREQKKEKKQEEQDDEEDEWQTVNRQKTAGPVRGGSGEK